MAEPYPIPEFTGHPADDLSFDLAGETYLHGCRILAAGRAGTRLEIHLLATSIEQVNLAAPLREPAVAATGVTAAGVTAAEVTAAEVTAGTGVDAGTSESTRPLDGPAAVRPPAISLSQRFVFTFADEVEAISEAIVIDHWGESGILVEGHVSGLQQGVMLFDPATRISTGVRLPLGT